MTTMDTIEISDCHDGTLEMIWQMRRIGQAQDRH
jgi:hypothetical protein